MDSDDEEGPGSLPRAPTPLEAALWFARQGVGIVPLHGVREGHCTCGSQDEAPKKRGKHPRRGWGPRHATTDPDEIGRVFERGSRRQLRCPDPEGPRPRHRRPCRGLGDRRGAGSRARPVRPRPPRPDGLGRRRGTSRRALVLREPGRRRQPGARAGNRHPRRVRRRAGNARQGRLRRRPRVAPRVGPRPRCRSGTGPASAD